MILVVRSAFHDGHKYVFLDECLHKLQTLEYDRIDVSEGIDVSKTTDSRKSNVCCYWYFLKINFRFQPKIFDGCHDLTHKAVGFNDITTFSRKGMIIELSCTKDG